jgi:RNA 3'-terminal phosphate cyclase (ATP)
MQDPVTAGAATLLLQISLPILLFAPSTTASTLTLKGGTNATNAPQIDYIQHVFLPFARRHFGLNVDLDVRRRGYFPKCPSLLLPAKRKLTQVYFTH